MNNNEQPYPGFTNQDNNQLPINPNPYNFNQVPGFGFQPQNNYPNDYQAQNNNNNPSYSVQYPQIYNANLNYDPFSNPYYNQTGQTYQDMKPNFKPNEGAIEIPAYNAVGLKDHDLNLNYNKFMVFFQNDSVNIFAFDFENRKWHKCPNYNHFKMLSYFRSVQTPEYGFYLTGGSHSDKNFSNNTYYYIDGYFTKKKEMINERRAHSSIYHEGYIYVFGGLTLDGGTDLCERYNILADQWESLPSLPQVRTLSSCCLFGKDLIYIMGGFHEPSDSDLLNIECFNVRTLSFVSVPVSMPLTLENAVVGQINESEIIIIGGFNQSKNKDSDEVHVVNVFSGKSAFKTKLPSGIWTIFSSPFLIRPNTLMVFYTGEDDFPPNFMEVTIN